MRRELLKVRKCPFLRISERFKDKLIYLIHRGLKIN